MVVVVMVVEHPPN
ncbi:hypothetical protein QR98_0083810 [Sarcoptes scabiei]|uniref:Uncharacterized protein n=1 Tax=Sarcoptes scabiei TaxID=52283 RepID=A0A132AFS8_SARSC|nr:hypothetical protein QR98_0083810 [Sarcoptes scabiei]